MLINYIKCPISAAIDIYSYVDSSTNVISITGTYSVIPFANENFLEYNSGIRYYYSGSGFWNGSGISFSIPIYQQDNFLTNYSSGTGYIGACLSGNIFYTGNSAPFTGRFTGIVYDPTISLQESLLTYSTGLNYYSYCLTGNIFHSGNINYQNTTTGIIVDLIYQIYDEMLSYPIDTNITGLTSMKYLHDASLEGWNGYVNQNNIYQSISGSFSVPGASVPDIFNIQDGGAIEFWIKPYVINDGGLLVSAGANQMKFRAEETGYKIHTITNGIQTYSGTGFINTGEWYAIAWSLGTDVLVGQTAGPFPYGFYGSRFYVNGKLGGYEQPYYFWSGYASGYEDTPGHVTANFYNFTGWFTGGVITGVETGYGGWPLASFHTNTGETGVWRATGLWSRYQLPTGSVQYTGVSMGTVPGLYSIIRCYKAKNIGLFPLGNYTYNPSPTGYPFFELVDEAASCSASWDYKYLPDVPVWPLGNTGQGAWQQRAGDPQNNLSYIFNNSFGGAPLYNMVYDSVINNSTNTKSNQYSGSLLINSLIQLKTESPLPLQ